MERLFDDLRTAWRSLLRRPAFTAVVVATLAVVLGANTAVFSVLEQSLLRPIPATDPDGLVLLERVNGAQTFAFLPTREQLRAWKESDVGLETLAAYETDEVALSIPGSDRKPEILRAVRADSELFPLLGARPLLGVGLEGGSERRALLGHRLWRERFGADQGVVGEAIRLGDDLYTVAGVLGPGLRSLPPVGAVDLWLPFEPVPAGPLTDIGAHGLARLAPGVSPAAAEERIVAFERHRTSEEEVAEWRPRVSTPREYFGRFLGRQLLILQAAVGLLLLVGCANVGNLFLVRAAGRRNELAVRAALGASRGRVARTLVFESLLVAGAAALCGLGLALAAGELLITLRDWPSLDLEAVRLDPTLFLFTAGAALLATVAFGLAPAWSASRASLGLALRSAGRSGGRSGARARSALVVAEIALSLVLLVGAGLLTRAFVEILTTDPGFVAESLVAISFELPEERYESEASREAFVRELREGLDELRRSGVRVALANAAPPRSGISFARFLPEGGQPFDPSAPPLTFAFAQVTPDYFRVTGITLEEGRSFTDEEARRSGATPVVLGRGLADHLFPGESAVGRRFTDGAGGPEGDAERYRVTGIATDAAQFGLRYTTLPQLYGPLSSDWSFALLVRVDEDDREATTDRVLAALHARDPRLPVRSVAAVALALAGLGVYAILEHTVRLRSFEIGVRAALGARPSQVLALIGRQGAALVATGLVLGLGAALLLSRLLGHLVVDVSPRDPAVYALATTALLAACALAILLPARRATEVDPVEVLREG